MGHLRVDPVNRCGSLPGGVPVLQRLCRAGTLLGGSLCNSDVQPTPALGQGASGMLHHSHKPQQVRLYGGSELWDTSVNFKSDADRWHENARTSE